MNEHCITCFKYIREYGPDNIKSFSNGTNLLREHAIFILRYCRTILVETIVEKMELIGDLVDELGGNDEAMACLVSFLGRDEGRRHDENSGPCAFSTEELQDLINHQGLLPEAIRFYHEQRIFL
jgi:hypothetical protein